EAVPRADQRESDVIATELVDHDIGRPDHDVYPVLRAHDADVGGEKPAAPPQLRERLAATQPLHVWPGTDDCDVPGPLTASRYGDLPVGIIGRDHMVGGPVSRALKRSQSLVGQFRAVGETRLVEFRTKIMMIEDKPG